MISKVQSLFIKVSPNIKKLPAVVIKELLRELTQSPPNMLSSFFKPETLLLQSPINRHKHLLGLKKKGFSFKKLYLDSVKNHLKQKEALTRLKKSIWLSKSLYKQD